MKRTRQILSILLCFWMLSAGVLSAQVLLSTQSKKAKKSYAQALVEFRDGATFDAIKSINKSLNKDAYFTEAYWLKADIYLHKGDIEMQTQTLRQALNPRCMSRLQTMLKLGQAYYSNGRYQEALDVYRMASNSSGVAEAIKEFLNENIAKCEFGVMMLANPLPYSPKNMGDKLNTQYHDYWPTLRGDEKEMVTTVLLPDPKPAGMQYQEDFYRSKWVNGDWTEANPIGKPLNTKNNEGAQCLSPDGNILFFTACNRFDGNGSCDIYISFKDGDDWSTPINPGAPLNTQAWEGHPSVSADGNMLYFSSERLNGKGGRDLWVAEMEQQGTRKIVFRNVSNLGDSINTAFNEISPFIHPDGQTLYFSSDGGHMGLGNNDIFMARKKADQSWGSVQNLGYPVNTHRDEIGFIVNAGASMGYFSTEGIGRERNDKDIYSVLLPEHLQPRPVTYLAGTIFDEQTHDPLAANFELFALEDGQLLQKTKATIDGKFFIMLPTGNSYALNVKNEGYLFYSDQFLIAENFSLDSPFVKEIPLKEIRKDQTVVLKNILFDFDSWRLQAASKAELANLIALLTQNPNMIIEIGGHTDGAGNVDYNLELSAKRAKEVIEYLIKAGISGERLKSKGYGATQPVSKDLLAPENRRTEFKVIEM